MYLPSGEKDGEPSKPLDALVRRLALPVSSATLYKNEDVAFCGKGERTAHPERTRSFLLPHSGGISILSVAQFGRV